MFPIDSIAISFGISFNESTATSGKLNAIKRLSEREQLVLSLYYEEDATLKEIAAILDVSIARVSQIHGRAIAKIRGYIEEANQE